MNRYFNHLMLLSASLLLLLASCKKDEAKIYFTGGTAPVLTSSVTTDSIPLHAADSTTTAAMFSWTNPNYQFNDGVSSMNVTYYLEFDTVGANFTNPKMVTVSFSSDLSTSFTESSLNSLINNGLQLQDSVQHQIQVRLESFLAPITSASPQGAPLYSSTFNYKVTPYTIPPKVTPPTTGELYIVGSATPGGSAHGWDNPITNTPVNQQKFTKISSTEYKITLPLIGGGAYDLLPVNGSWSVKYNVVSNSAAGLPTAGSFQYSTGPGQDVPGPAATGTYTIDVNFQTGTFSVTQ
jgi:hypothetical protein